MSDNVLEFTKTNHLINIHMHLGFGDVCAVGYHCPLGSSLPVSCPEGTYQDEIGQDYCKQCMEGEHMKKKLLTLFIWVMALTSIISYIYGSLTMSVHKKYLLQGFLEILNLKL